MKGCRSRFPVCQIMYFFVCFFLIFPGGYDGEDFLPTVECYDPKEGTWTIITKMSSGRSGAGVAVGMEPCKTSMCSGMVMELN